MGGFMGSMLVGVPDYIRTGSGPIARAGGTSHGRAKLLHLQRALISAVIDSGAGTMAGRWKKAF